MYVYLSNKYVTKDNVLKAVDLAIIDDDGKLKTEVVYANNFYTIAEKYKGCSFDFDPMLVGNFSDHVVSTYFIKDESELPKETVFCNNTITSLHQIFDVLVHTESLYIPSFLNLNDTSSYLGVVPFFRDLRVSSSTMTIGISVLNEDTHRWRTEKLVYCENGSRIIEQSDFYFAIEVNKINRLDNVKIEIVKNIEINRVKYYLCKYTAYTYSVFNEMNNFCYPAIVHFCFLEFLTKSVITILEEIVERISPVRRTDISELEKSKNFSNLANSGYFFKLRKTNLTKEDCKKHLDNFLLLIDLSRKENLSITKSTIKEYIKNQKCDFGMLYVFQIIIDLIQNDSGVLKDLDSYQNALAFYKLNLLDYQLILYNLRVLGLRNPKLISYPRILNKFEITGSVFKRIVLVERRNWVDRG